MILIDTNVLIDVIAPGQAWRDWSLARLEECGADDAMAIDTTILAELASGFPSLAEATEWLSRLGVEIRTLGEEAAFAGGRAFREFRRDGGDRVAILADFLIGGHARHLGASLLTRDLTIYRRYFPDLTLITPETHP